MKISNQIDNQTYNYISNQRFQMRQPNQIRKQSINKFENKFTILSKRDIETTLAMQPHIDDLCDSKDVKPKLKSTTN